MSTTYTPDAGNNPSTITLPSDLDDLVAEAFNVAFRALGDKVAYAIATKAALAASNTFTFGQRVEPAEVDPLLFSTRFPGQFVSGNRWAQIFKFNVESNRTVRVYTGALSGVGRLAFTLNASWSTDDQLWSLEDDSASAAAILWASGGFYIYSVPSGTSPFLGWPAASSSTEGNVKIAGEFRYLAAKARQRTIPTAHCAGLYSIDAADGSIGVGTIGDHSLIRWPLQLPPGAVLTKVSVLHHIDSSAAEEFRLTRRRTVWDAGSPAFPAETVLSTVTSDSGVGDHITEITTSQSVDKYDELNLVWVPSGLLSNNVHAISVEWSDQGPTPL